MAVHQSTAHWFSHIAIGVSDISRSVPFYTALGFSVTVQRIERSAALNVAMANTGELEDRHVCYMKLYHGSPPQFLALHYRASI